MKLRTQLALSALACSIALTTGCNANNPQSKSAVTINEQSSEIDKVGYSFGYLIGKDGKTDLSELNVDTFEKGFRDGFEGKDPALTDAQMQEVLNQYQQKKQQELIKEAEEAAAKNKAEGDKFLAENAKKDGVKTTKSGLQYKVIKEGTGKSPKATDSVTVNYEGKLLDGTVFDSSYQRNEPVTFPLNQMIAGWTEGLQLMKEGSKYELYIPADLAYGEAGNPSIEPNSTLIFTVELLGVNKEDAKKH